MKTSDYQNNHSLPEYKNNKMLIKVVREVFTDTVTIGRMFIDGKEFAFTLEDKYRSLHGDCSKKVQNSTCIDIGAYKAILTQSTRFKRMLPELQNVPCFSSIRMHGGNTEADTEGCILVAAETDHKTKVWNCADKVNSLVEQMKGKDVTIAIEGVPVIV